jgi:hypothetical protein
VAQHRLRLVIHARVALGVLEAKHQFRKIVLDIWTSHNVQPHAEHPRNECLRDDHKQLPREGLS